MQVSTLARALIKWKKNLQKWYIDCCGFSFYWSDLPCFVHLRSKAIRLRADTESKESAFICSNNVKRSRSRNNIDCCHRDVEGFQHNSLTLASSSSQGKSELLAELFRNHFFYAMRCYWEPTWGKNPLCAVFERLFQNFLKNTALRNPKNETWSGF